MDLCLKMSRTVARSTPCITSKEAVVERVEGQCKEESESGDGWQPDNLYSLTQNGRWLTTSWKPDIRYAD